MYPKPITPPPGAAPMEDELHLRHYWHIMLERRWLVATAFLSVFVLCLIYLYRAVPVYQAVGVVEISREIENVMKQSDQFTMETREQDYLQTQYKKLKSLKLIDFVISRLHLEQDPRYLKAFDKEKAVAEDIQIVPVRFSRLVEVRVNHTSPVQAANIASNLIARFEEENLNQKKQSATDALEKLRTEVDLQKHAVEQADTDLQKYKEQIGKVSVEDAQNVITSEMKEAGTALVLAQSIATRATKLDEEVQKLLAGGAGKESIQAVAEDHVIQELHAQLVLRKAELASLLKRYKDPWDTVIQKREEVDSLQKSIDAKADEVIRTIRNAALISLSQQYAAETNVAKWEQKQLALTGERLTYDRLNREAETKRQLYIKALQTQQELELSIPQKANNIHTVDEPKPPLKPIQPRVMLTLVLGLIGGLVVAMALAFFVNYLDDSIKIQDDVEVYLRLPFLGYVPNIKSNSVIERDLQAHVHPQSTAAEGFRTIRAAIALMPKAERFRLLVVTSTIPSEGKSLLASNLAIVTAQTGAKTLLVDADLRRPSVHKAFQLHSPIGLSAYLTENVSSVDEMIHTTEVPGLDVVCAGAIPTNPSELSGSKRMRQFLQEVGKRYDKVFVDCPPVSAVSDPLVIAAMTDGVVFLTKFNKVRREHARKSVQRIQDAGIHVLGVVLNDIDFEGKDSYYYSYYYYQNRYYSSHYQNEPKDKPKPTLEKT